MPNLGGKAAGLKLLTGAGLPVPEFLIITHEEISDLLMNEEKLDKFCLNLLAKFGKQKLAFRSSANKEDGCNKSYAGFFSSELNVKIQKDFVRKAIKRVYESAKRAPLEEEIQMNILVQRMIHPVISGVCFTEAFDSSKVKYCTISFVKGLANKLVDGRAKASSLLIPYKGKKLDIEKIRFSGNISGLSDAFKDLIKSIQNITQKIYPNADVEWCIDKNHQVWIVQLRKITAEIQLEQKVNDCTIASNGTAHAKAFCINSSLPTEELEKEIKSFPNGAILVSEYTDTLFMPAIKKASAIITEEGDLLSHSAIVARELKIPCIVGINDIYNKIKTGDDIVLNTKEQVLTINAQYNLLNTNRELDLTGINYFENVVEIPNKNDSFLLEYGMNEAILYYKTGCDEARLQRTLKILSSKINLPIRLSNSNKYHWYFEWKNFSQLGLFQKYLKIAQDYILKQDLKKTSELYREITNIAIKLKQDSLTTKKLKQKLLLEEEILSLYFLLDMYLPQGLGMVEAYKKFLALRLEKHIDFVSLLDKDYPIRNKQLKHIQLFLSALIKEKNKIFREWMEKGILTYDFMSQRDALIRNLFNDKYPKYNEVMYDKFYQKYIL